MDAKQLREVHRGLMWMVERMAELPEEREGAAEAMVACTGAMFRIAGLANHLEAGVEPYEAMVRIARGDWGLTDEQKMWWRLMSQPGVAGPDEGA